MPSIGFIAVRRDGGFSPMMTTQEFIADTTPRAGFWRVRAKVKANLSNETRQEIAVVTPPPPQSRDGELSSSIPLAVPAIHTGASVTEPDISPKPRAKARRVAAPEPVAAKPAGSGATDILPDSADPTPRRNASPMLPVHLPENGSGPALPLKLTPAPSAIQPVEAAMEKPAPFRSWVEDYAKPPEPFNREAVKLVMSRRGKSINGQSPNTKAYKASMANAAEAAAREKHRREDPFEQAKAFLQKRGPVFSATFRNGPKGEWFVDGQRGFLTSEQVIELAKRKGWKP